MYYNPYDPIGHEPKCRVGSGYQGSLKRTKDVILFANLRLKMLEYWSHNDIKANDDSDFLSDIKNTIGGEMDFLLSICC